MAMTEWSLFSRMSWKKCRQGYTLQGGAIVARPVNPPSVAAQPANQLSASAYLLGPGPEDRAEYAMDEYCPDELNRMAHREFMKLESGDNEGLLAFVSEYGLLGLDGGGPPKRESLAHLWLAHDYLWIYAHWSQDAHLLSQSDRKLPSDRNTHFNNFCPQHMSVCLEKENGRTVLKTKVGSLIAWMWLRLAQEVAGDLLLKKCKLPTCAGEWYEGHGQKSSRKEYCNPRCRAAHHYGMDMGRFSRSCERPGCDEKWVELRQEGLEPRKYCSLKCEAAHLKDVESQQRRKPVKKGGSK
jgi:hypothetical protein